MKNIVVGTDFSKGSYVALEIATMIANVLVADIELIWVCKEKNLFSSEQTESVRHLAEEKLQNLAEKTEEILFPETSEKAKEEIVDSRRESCSRNFERGRGLECLDDSHRHQRCIGI